MGDLAEEFSQLLQFSGSCRSWYWGQTLRSIPTMAWRAVRQGGWIRTFLVALGAYVGAGLVEFAAEAALSEVVNAQSLLHTVLSLILGLVTMAAGGYAAARLCPGAHTVLGAIIFVIVMVFLTAHVGDAPL